MKFDNEKKKKLTGFEQVGAGETKTFSNASYKSPTSTTINPLKAGAYPDFIPKSSFTPEEWKEAVNKVNTGEGVFEPGTAQQKVSKKGIEPTQPKEKKSFLTKTAEFGVWPAVFMANLISGGVEKVSGYDMGKITTEQFAEKPVGKGLGLATVAAELALAGVVTKMLVSGIGGSAAAGEGGAATITRTASKIGGSGEELASVTTQRAFQALGGGTSNVNKLFLASKNLSAAGTKTLLTKGTWLKIGGTVSGASLIMTWMASDNIMQGVSIMTRDLSDAVQWQGMPPQEAMQTLEEAEQWKNRAEKFVKINSKINPLLWPFGKILLTNAKTAQAQLDLQRRNILSINPVQNDEENNE